MRRRSRIAKMEIRGYRGRRGRTWKTLVLCVLLAGAICFSALLGLVLSGARDVIVGQPRAMIVLGCRVYPWGPSILLQDRMDEALEYLQKNPDVIVVTSGGQGSNEPASEAATMRDYFLSRGIAQERILVEEESSNTWENLNFSRELLAESGHEERLDPIIVVSNGFHLTRVRMLALRVWGEEVELSTLSAPSSHVPSRLKMYVREPLALVKSFLMDR